MADKERLIDAELLTANIAQIAKNCARSDAQKALIGRILFMIENMPTIEAEPVNGWISVDDRPPDDVEEVLIYCPEFCEEIKQATWCGEDFLVEREDLIVEPAPNGYCTHWMPLPEKPKGIVMDEYISREAAVRYLKGYSEKELNWNHDFGKVTSSVLDKAERAISEMPAADVQPVKHGRWIDNGICDSMLSACSICGYSCGAYSFNYCPNCGSKNRMDGESE